MLKAAGYLQFIRVRIYLLYSKRSKCLETESTPTLCITKTYILNQYNYHSYENEGGYTTTVNDQENLNLLHIPNLNHL